MKLRKALKKSECLVLIGLLLFLQGCGTTSTQGLISAGGAAAGAAIGYAASDKNPYWTVGGAAAGVLVGTLANYKLTEKLKAAERQGFEKALNQSARQHYWILQNLQKENDLSKEPSGSYYPITRPEVTVEDITFGPSTEYVLLYE